jgi:NAD(P)-dependent dehydrogenase (short-subunit alcohol dehydrogenase family)
LYLTFPAEGQRIKFYWMKNVIVLGGSSGIGKAIAERFADEGHRVLVASDNYGKALAVSEHLKGGQHLAYKVDVRKDAEIAGLASFAEQSYGSLDVLVNSVGISEGYPLTGTDFACWDNTLQVMMYGAVKCARALIPLLRNGSRIIHITSIHHERVAANSSAYGMAKAAITQLTRGLAVELAPQNILVNAVAPGFVDTPMSVKADGRNELDSEWFKDNYIKYGHLPLKRAACPSEVAGVAYFLAGPDASYITGSVLTVDGGLTITF